MSQIARMIYNKSQEDTLLDQGYRLLGYHGIVPIWEKPDEIEDLPDWLRPTGKVEEPSHWFTKLTGIKFL